MVLKNYSQNKWNSESNVSKNTSKPCASNFSEYRVKKLIQIYEHLNAKNNDSLSGAKYYSSEQNLSSVKSEMLGDLSINLNKNNIHRFLSLDNDESNNKYVFNESRKNEVSNHVKDCVKKMPSQSKKTSRLKSYEVDKERKQDQSKNTSSPKKKEDLWKLFTSCNEPKNKKYDNRRDETKKDRYKQTSESDKDKIQFYSYSLPSGKKKENNFGKQFLRSFSATTTRDNKLKTQTLSNNQYKSDNFQLLPKDGSSIVKTRIETYTTPEKQTTGAIKKQLSADDVTYRRRPSYLMATQNDSFRKLRVFPEKVETNQQKQNYVRKTISRFENDITRKSNKFEHDIKQLFQQYHEKKKFGTTNKMTREELSLEIDNVLLNKNKQISSDSTPAISTDTSVAQNRSSTPQNVEQDETITVVIQQPEDTTTKCSETDQTSIQTDYVIIMHDSEMSTDISQGHQNATKLNLESTDATECSLNVREKLSAQLNKVLSSENLQGSVKNLCNDIVKDLDVINKRLSAIDLEITDISVVEEENMIENNHDRIHQNMEKEKDKNNADEAKPKKKVLNLVNFFSDIIKEVSTDRSSTLDNRKSSISSTPTIVNDDEIFKSPNNQRCEKFRYSTVSTPEYNQNYQTNIFNPTYSSESSSSNSFYEENFEKLEENSNLSIIYSPTVNISCREDERLEEKQLPLEGSQNIFEKCSKQVSSICQTPLRSSLYRRNSLKTNISSEKSYNKIEHLEENQLHFETSQNILEESKNKLSSICQTPQRTGLFTNNSFRSNISTEESRNNQHFEESCNEVSSICQTPQRSGLSSRNSFRTNTSSEENFEFTQYKNGNIRSIKTLTVQEQSELLRKELSYEISLKRNPSFKHPIQESEDASLVEDVKPRLSRLYTGKFSKSENTVKQDNNNNECTTTQKEIDETDMKDENVEMCEEKTIEITNSTLLEKHLNAEEDICDKNILEETLESKQIFENIENDTFFFSDSEGDYDLTETYNMDNDEFIALQKKLSTTEWVEKSIKRIKKYRKESPADSDEDTEHIYEQIRRSGSTGTLCTIYDEHNNPTIRMSMIDISGDFVVATDQMQEDKCEETEIELKKNIEKSEQELRKSIQEIQDNSKKACLINELITTENNFINISLHRLVHDYMPEMDKENTPKGLMGKSRQIFGNADMIYEGHKKNFLPDLEKHTSIEDLANCFLKHETIFKLYPLYSKNKPKSDVVLKDFNYYFKEKQDALNDKLDLASYLLTPIQRLAKYCLLMKSLVKECEKENIECERLKSALEMLNKQMRMGNDLIALDSIVNYDSDIREHGEVLLRDSFVVTPPNKKPPYEGMIFLFQECLLITAVSRQDSQETFIYKDSFQLTDMGYTPDVDTGSLEFSVWFRKHDIKTYRFRTKNYDLKEKWVKEIFSLLWKQLEANKKRKKKELEENGVRETRVPVVHRPYSVPNKGKPSSRSSSTKSTRKRIPVNLSVETIWYG